MGIRSDVAICMKARVVEHLSPEIRKFLDEWGFSEREVVKEGDDAGTLFYTSDVKWYSDSYPSIIAFYRYMEGSHAEDDYLIIEACSEFPDTDGGNAGCWEDNPWNLYKEVSAELHWNCTS